MASTEHLIEGAREATGDSGITVGGIFLPRGFVGRTMLGSMVGSVAGNAVGGDTGSLVGSSLGMAAGMGSTASEGLTFVVAVSPTHVYVLRPIGVGGIRGERLDTFHSFDRSHLSVEVKARATVRILILEDMTDDVRIELEGSRVHFKHANDIVHALVIDGHGDVPAAPATI